MKLQMVGSPTSFFPELRTVYALFFLRCDRRWGALRHLSLQKLGELGSSGLGSNLLDTTDSPIFYAGRAPNGSKSRLSLW